MNIIYEFADYLNHNGYCVTSDRVERFLKAFGGSGLDVTESEDAVAVMRVVFCAGRKEQDGLPEHFRYFIRHRDEIREEREERERKKKRLDEALRNIKEKQEALKKEMREKQEEGPPSAFPFSRSQKAVLAARPGLDALLEGKTMGSYDLDALEEVAAGIIRESEQALLEGDLSRFRELEKIHNVLRRVISKAEKFQAEAAKTAQEKERELRAKLRKLEAERKRKQEELDGILERIAGGGVTLKPEASMHRMAFHGGGAVISPSAGELMDRSFNALTDRQKKQVYEYIRDNISAFRTRYMRRNHTEGAVNMQRTIAEACRTGGHPLKLCYDMPKRSKTDLILVLDVSGSCKEASGMMLAFMHALQSVFPRGCRAYAFVNSLYDISKVMETDDADVAIRETLGMIPRAGVYSNYEVPLRQLWNEHNQELSRDSMVIFMGDCRNNKNDAGEDYIRNICRRVKNSMWLNTEQPGEWDHGDSIAGIYGKYAKMRPVLTPGDLLTCIEEI